MTSRDSVRGHLTDTQQTLLPFLSFSTIPSQRRTGWSINDDVVMARVDLATGLLFFLVAWSSFLFTFVSAHPPQTSSGKKSVAWASFFFFFFYSFDFIKFFYYALASYKKQKKKKISGILREKKIVANVCKSRHLKKNGRLCP